MSGAEREQVHPAPPGSAGAGPLTVRHARWKVAPQG
jgi:hypothetical protein